MKRAPWLLFALLPACLGETGPELPPNIGQTHAAGHTGSERPVEPEAEPEPVPVGTTVWAEHRSTGFYLLAVVVAQREDGDHRVIFADGSPEWVPPEALRPDSLGEDAHVQVRPAYGGNFNQGIVTRRLGDAIYVRYASGDESWAALPHVRFEDGGEGTPRRGDAPVAAAPEGTGPGAAVMVDYGGNGLRFAGTVTAVADDGRRHVVYLDNSSEWVQPALIAPEALGEGQQVHVRRRWDPPDWVRGRVRARFGHALTIELDDGGMAWTSMFRIREPVPAGGAPDAEPAPPAPDASDDESDASP